MAMALEELLTKEMAKDFYHCYPLLPIQGKLFLSAVAKSFKSMLALNIAYSLSQGTAVLGRHPTVKPRRVLVMEQEIGPERLKDRLLKMNPHIGGPLALKNLWFASKDMALRLDTINGIAKIEEAVREAKPHIVILDPLRKFHLCNEDNSTEMGGVMRSLTTLQEKHKFAAIVVHHHSKPNEMRRADSPANLRGSSVLFDEGDSYLTITRPNPKERTTIALTYTLRSAEDPPPLLLTLDPNTLVFIPETHKEKL